MSDVALAFRERTQAHPARGWVPALLFDIVVERVMVGQITLRLGETEPMRLYGGQVGYRVVPEAWGRGYATAALVALKPIAMGQGFVRLWVTCRPDNLASRRVLEKAEAVFVETVAVPEDSDLFARGDRVMCRYRLDL